MNLSSNLNKWKILHFFFNHLALTNNIIKYNIKLHKAVNVSRTQLKIFYFNTVAFILPQLIAVFLNTIRQLRYPDDDGSSSSFHLNIERGLRIIFGVFFISTGSIYIIFFHSLTTKKAQILLAYNSIFRYEAKVTSKSAVQTKYRTKHYMVLLFAMLAETQVCFLAFVF
jgi:hypothetical protein